MGIIVSVWRYGRWSDFAYILFGVMAGDGTVLLPKGLVLYPVNEQEEKESFYPGGQYKIYVSLESDASNLNSTGWPNGCTNLTHMLKR